MSNIEGRCITIARIRAGMTQYELADRLHYTTMSVGRWETGQRIAPWNLLSSVLPELPEIREKGCMAYCPKADECKKDGKCLISRLGKCGTYEIEGKSMIVRCKACKHYEDPEKGIFENCTRNGWLIPMLPDDFCSYGERRTTNEAD